MMDGITLSSPTMPGVHKMSSDLLDADLGSLSKDFDMLKRFKSSEVMPSSVRLDPMEAARQKFIQGQRLQLSLLKSDRAGGDGDGDDLDKQRNTRCWRKRPHGTGYDVTLRYGIRLLAKGALVADTLDDVEAVIIGFIAMAEAGKIDDLLSKMYSNYSKARSGKKKLA